MNLNNLVLHKIARYLNPYTAADWGSTCKYLYTRLHRVSLLRIGLIKPQTESDFMQLRMYTTSRQLGIAAIAAGFMAVAARFISNPYNRKYLRVIIRSGNVPAIRRCMSTIKYRDRERLYDVYVLMIQSMPCYKLIQLIKMTEFDYYIIDAALAFRRYKFIDYYLTTIHNSRKLLNYCYIHGYDTLNYIPACVPQCVNYNLLTYVGFKTLKQLGWGESIQYVLKRAYHCRNQPLFNQLRTMLRNDKQTIKYIHCIDNIRLQNAFYGATHISHISLPDAIATNNIVAINRSKLAGPAIIYAIIYNKVDMIKYLISWYPQVIKMYLANKWEYDTYADFAGAYICKPGRERIYYLMHKYMPLRSHNENHPFYKYLKL